MSKTLHPTRKLSLEGAVDADDAALRAFLGDNARALFDIGA